MSVSGICEDKGFKPKFYMLGELANTTKLQNFCHHMVKLMRRVTCSITYINM